MCPVTPYSPWPVAEKPVSHEKMLDILAKRINGMASSTVEPGPRNPEIEGSSPSPSPALEWGKTIWYEPGVVGCQISTCGRYRVDKCGSSYTAWRKAQSRDQLNLRLGEVDKIEAAQALCETDAQSR